MALSHDTFFRAIQFWATSKDKAPFYYVMNECDVVNLSGGDRAQIFQAQVAILRI